MRGIISMDVTMADVTDIPDAALGDIATVYGTVGQQVYPANVIARSIGTVHFRYAVGREPASAAFLRGLTRSSQRDAAGSTPRKHYSNSNPRRFYNWAGRTNSLGRNSADGFLFLCPLEVHSTFCNRA